MFELKSFENAQIALDEAAASLNSALSKEKNSQVLLLLSGGSALAILDKIEPSSLSQNITVSVLDERYSLDSVINNMAQIAATEFYKSAKNAGCKFIDTRVLENETQQDLVERFNSSLLSWFEKNPKGKIIATVGMGPDGHTSGIMPYSENPELFKTMFEGEKLAVAYDTGDKNEFRERVSTTITFMRKINTAICYIVGQNKRELLVRLLNENGTLPEMPARILKEIENAIIFTDQKT